MDLVRHIYTRPVGRALKRARQEGSSKEITSPMRIFESKSLAFHIGHRCLPG